MARLALSATIKGAWAQRHRQRRAVSAVARSALQTQQTWVSQLFEQLKVRPEGGDSQSTALSPTGVIALGWQWDETAQRVRAVLGDR